MTSIDVRSIGPDRYGVEVREGELHTAHEVAVHAALLDDLGLADADPTVVVEQSFAFLLEREPASAILRSFALEDIARYFPEYYHELRTRLSS